MLILSKNKGCDLWEDIVIEEKNIHIDGATIHYLEAGQKTDPDILFLHGMKFSAQTWNDLGTLTFFESNGFHPVAVDLPGFGKSDDLPMEKEAILPILMDRLALSKPFVVAPSFSGGYSYPLVVDDPDRLSGFVAVATTNIPDYAERLSGNSLPVLAVWGSQDGIVPIENSELLCRSVTNSTKVVFEGAEHPCYMTETDAFHQHLLAFFRG